MDLSGIEIRIALIKEKTIDRIDSHFKEYLMGDLVGQKGIESTIDDMDWYGYWKEVALDIKFVIDDLLEYAGLVDSKDGLTYDKNLKANDLLKEVLSYKMICDKNLQSNKHYSIKNVQEEVFSIKDKIDFNDSFPPLSIVNEKHKDEIILILHTYLVRNEIIKGNEFENFTKLFVSESKPDMIKWQKDAIFFVAFIELLLDKQVIELPFNFKDKQWEYFMKLFTNKEGKTFSTRLLGNRKTQNTYDIKRKDIENTLFQALNPFIT